MKGISLRFPSREWQTCCCLFVSLTVPPPTRIDHSSIFASELALFRSMMSFLIGIAACCVAGVFFGSMFVAVRRCDAGDGQHLLITKVESFELTRRTEK